MSVAQCFEESLSRFRSALLAGVAALRHARDDLAATARGHPRSGERQYPVLPLGDDRLVLSLSRRRLIPISSPSAASAIRLTRGSGLARDTAAEDEFIEIYVEAPLETVIARDPKGLYKRALAGEIQNFTGIDQTYETPETPEMILNSAQETAAALADRVIEELERRGRITRL